MKILFLHPNFPAQFKHISKHLASLSNEVFFLCQTNYGKSVEGVKILKLKGKAGHDELNSQNLNLVERTKFLSEQYRSGFLKLKNDHWEPDIVISHSGWGCGMYVKEIWPNCKFITYLEWWFDPSSDFFHYDESNEELGINRNSIKKNWDRNRFIALELASSDQIICPTQWQRSQLPHILRENCEVVFDGVDLNYFNVDLLSRNANPTLTYGTRGMDPFRGFPQFIRSLPKIIDLNKSLNVEIAGNNSVFYGSMPNEFKSWQEWANDYLRKHNIAENVTWRGFLQPEEYLKWLQSSWCHVYFTHPFVASWSMVEALACGAHMVVSDVEATKEFCENVDGVSLVDHRDTSKIVHSICELLESSSRIRYYERHDKLKKFSRETGIEGWSKLIEKVHT